MKFVIAIFCVLNLLNVSSAQVNSVSKTDTVIISESGMINNVSIAKPVTTNDFSHSHKLKYSIEILSLSNLNDCNQLNVEMQSVAIPFAIYNSTVKREIITTESKLGEIVPEMIYQTNTAVPLKK